MPTGVYERTERCREALSRARKRDWQNSEYRKAHIEALKKTYAHPEVRKRCSEAQKKKWQNPGYAERFSGENHPLYGKKYSERARREMSKRAQLAQNRPEVKMRQREASIKAYARPEVKMKHKEASNRPEVKAKRSRARKKLWQNPEWRENQIKLILKASHIRPNKAEMKLTDFLQQILPNEYEYVGNGEFILAGKCPDFVNINGQKKIIEHFGDHWHKGDDGKERIKLFKQYGYQTLIVWEHELEDEKELRNKILSFNDEVEG